MNDIVSAVLASVMANGILGWIFKSWFAEQLRQKISFEYAQKLETIKAQLTTEQERALEQLRTENVRLQVVQATANASFTEGHKAAHERRLKAIEILWREIVKIGETIPAAVFSLDHLLASEFQDFFTNPHLMPQADALVAGRYQYVLSQRPGHIEVDQCRPFFGEQLFLIFFVYRAVIGRICWLTTKGVEERNIPDWRLDSGIKQILSWLLSETEISTILEKRFGGIGAIKNTMETKALEQMQHVISGQAAGEFSLEESKKVADYVSQLNAQESRS